MFTPPFTVPPVHEPGDSAITALDIAPCQNRAECDQCHGCQTRAGWLKRAARAVWAEAEASGSATAMAPPLF